jgi:hypothetical protein
VIWSFLLLVLATVLLLSLIAGVTRFQMPRYVLLALLAGAMVCAALAEAVR